MQKCDWDKNKLSQIVSESLSLADVLKTLGLEPKGGNYKTLKKKLTEFQIDISHFTGQGWNTYGNPDFGKGAIPLNNQLTTHSSLSSSFIRKRLLSNHIKENKCECCGITEWQGKPIICELHHINGDHTDNRIDNLMMLCPNCHSQTKTFRSRNRTVEANKK